MTRVTLVGFSAGSMLAIAMAGARSQPNPDCVTERLGNTKRRLGVEHIRREAQERAYLKSSMTAMRLCRPRVVAGRADQLDRLRVDGEDRTLECVVGVHGPDRIRDVFEAHQGV